MNLSVAKKQLAFIRSPAFETLFGGAAGGKSYAQLIDRCCLCGLFSGQNDTRVFVAGNPDKPNVHCQSGLYDPSYFPDTGYTQVGSDGSAIVGYLRQYDTQLVLKEDRQDAKQYLRTFSLDEDGNAVYPLRQGA